MIIKGFHTRAFSLAKYFLSGIIYLQAIYFVIRVNQGGKNEEENFVTISSSYASDTYAYVNGCE